MREIVLLGTGTPNIDPARCGSGVALVGDEGWLLVDCGRGVTQRILQAGLDLEHLVAVLLTHHHSDHVSDLATLAITRWSNGSGHALTVFAPAGLCVDYVDHCVAAFPDQSFHGQADPTAGLRPSMIRHAFHPTDDPAIVAVVGAWEISSALVDHHPIEAAVGYRISDGTHSVTISGDTAVGPGIERLADRADVLIHEALNPDRVGADLLAWNAGADTVGALAVRARVGRLVLTHLIPTPRDQRQEQEFIDHARLGGYRGRLDLATDLMRFEPG